MAGAPLSELNRPLGQVKPAGRPSPIRRWVVRVGLALAAVGAFGFVGYRIASGPADGGPSATALIARQDPSPPTAQAAASQPTSPPAQASGPSTARELENEAGVTVVRPGSEAPGSIIIRIPDPPQAIRLAPAPDRRLVERTRHGLLPKVGDDGATPALIYARPLGPAAETKPSAKVAILIGGLGISQSGTADAITRLPGAVSFAFAPYAAELDKTVARARAEGHEAFLQVPMEPFDYPDNDPGPHTLLTGPKGSENLDRLLWALGRFTGYVGIVNFLGGRLTADEAALSPLLKEVAGRGLMVIDDGSSPRSQLFAMAGKAQLPALKADLVLDQVTRADAIDKELQRLETLARERGAALASASALPVTIERIARWARTLPDRNIQLIPASAVRTQRNPSSTGSLR